MFISINVSLSLSLALPKNHFKNLKKTHKTDNIKCYQGCGKVGLSYIVSGNVKWHTFANSQNATLENSLVLLLNLNIQ